MSIRARVTLFGLAVVGGVLALFGIVVYVVLAAGVPPTQDQALAARSRQVAAALPATVAVAGEVPGGADPARDDEIYVVVLDRSGRVLLATGRPPRVPAGRVGFLTASAGGAPVRVHARPWTGGTVLAVQTTRKVSNDRAGLAILIIVYVLLAFPVAGVAIFLVAGRALRPLGQLAALADGIGRSVDLTRRLPPAPRADALGRLTTSFNTMMDRLAGVFEAQRRFTADASHELRTPLTTIRSNAGFLLRHPDAAPADREAALRDIAGESERMSRLVDSLLTLARADAGQRLSLVPVDLAGLAESVCRQARTLHPDREISCATTPTPDVAGDRDALAQLIWILLDNAAKYTQAGGTIWVAVTQRGRRAQLHVSDDGPGLPPGSEHKVFERFHRADPARSGGGAGLGLSIAAWIVRAHGGTIVAANNARGGASFVAELPSH